MTLTTPGFYCCHYIGVPHVGGGGGDGSGGDGGGDGGGDSGAQY